MIDVTKPSLPDLQDYMRYLERIWQTRWITNHGQLEQLLEKKLKEYLRLKELVLVSNGTLALQLALRSFKLRGEVITTPFTFVATTNAIIWEGLTPVFADIDPETFNIDPEDVEKKITRKTCAILAVHVYGNPCKIDTLQKTARENNLALIFDGAHSFGVEHENKSVFTYGDISTLSFHATKVFNTIEGGAIATGDRKLSEKIRCMSDHGIKSEEETVCVGTNAKINEFQAAMGLCNLYRVKSDIEHRKTLYELYKRRLSGCGDLTFQKIVASKYNYCYMPVLFKSLKARESVRRSLLGNGIRARRYFYPLTTNVANSAIRKNDASNRCPTNRALNVSERVLCLPLYPELAREDVNRISEVIEYALSEETGT